MDQADLDSNSDVDDDNVYIFLTCVNQALPFFSSQIQTTSFVKYTCEKFFPLTTWHLIGATDDQIQTQLRVLKIFAELCSNCGSLDNPKEKIETVFNILLEYLPSPPVNLDEEINILFSHVECLLYSIHSLGKQCPEFLAFPEDPDRLKDFRARLQYLARGTQG